MAHGHTGPTEPSAESLRLGYESLGVHVRGLMWFLFYFVVTMVLIMGALVWLYRDYSDEEKAADMPRSALADVQLPLPPGPRLQPSPGHDVLPDQDLQIMYHNEDEIFARMGWDVNLDSHRVELPDRLVEQVARQTAERAARPPQPATQSAPSDAPRGAPAEGSR